MLPFKFKLLMLLPLTLIASEGFAFHLDRGHASMQLGGYVSSEGKAQNIAIQGLIGNHYSVSKGKGSNGLVGFAYLLDGPETKLLHLAYGVDVFYFPGRVPVSGNITQEQLFTNLAYDYKVSSFPVYAEAKANLIGISTEYAVTFDVGIGPNFVNTSHYREHALSTFSLTGNTFSGKSSTTFSAMAGVGLKMNNAFGTAPLECGYRFFYLGQGELRKNTTRLVSTLTTGGMYANALICSLTV